MEVELAVALSARTWSDELHRFLADHGGARVRLTAMQPDDLFVEEFDVLLIDDTCSFLTPRLIDRVNLAGRRVVGVYDPDEFEEGKARLLECGVSDVIEAGAEPDEFLEVIARVASIIVTATPVPVRSEALPRTGTRIIRVGGPHGGAGITEVALACARRLAEQRRQVFLVDLDQESPSISQRLGLPLHPNLRTFLDIIEHRSGSLERSFHKLEGISVLVGGVVGHPGERMARVPALLTEVLPDDAVVVVDGGRHPIPPGASATRAVERMVAVGTAAPVGVARLLGWLADLGAAGEGIDILINRAPSDRFRRAEIVEEVTRAFQPSAFAFIPDDPAVTDAAWDGHLLRRGKFKKAVDRWVDRFIDGALA